MTEAFQVSEEDETMIHDWLVKAANAIVEASSLRKRVAELEQEVERLGTVQDYRIRDLTVAMNEARLDINKAEADREQISSELVDLRRERDDLRQRCDLLEIDLAEDQTARAREVRELNEALAEAQRKALTESDSNSLLREWHEEDLQRIEHLRKQNGNLAEELVAAQKDRDEYKQMFEMADQVQTEAAAKLDQIRKLVELVPSKPEPAPEPAPEVVYAGPPTRW